MLLRLSFSSFWSEIKRWLNCSSGFGSCWYTDCNCCENEGTKPAIVIVLREKKWNESQTYQTPKIQMMWWETSVSVLISACLFFFLMKWSDIREAQQWQHNQEKKQHWRGLPLCGVRPMVTEAKRAAAEEVKSDRRLPTQTLEGTPIQSRNFIHNVQNTRMHRSKL